MEWSDLKGKTITSVAVAHEQDVKLRFSDGTTAYLCSDGDERGIYTQLRDKADGTGYGDEEYEEQ